MENSHTIPVLVKEQFQSIFKSPLEPLKVSFIKETPFIPADIICPKSSLSFSILSADSVFVDQRKEVCLDLMGLFCERLKKCESKYSKSFVLFQIESVKETIETNGSTIVDRYSTKTSFATKSSLHSKFLCQLNILLTIHKCYAVVIPFHSDQEMLFVLSHIVLQYSNARLQNEQFNFIQEQLEHFLNFGENGRELDWIALMTDGEQPLRAHGKKYRKATEKTLTLYFRVFFYSGRISKSRTIVTSTYK